MTFTPFSRVRRAALVAGVVLLGASLHASAQSVPAPGSSARIDAIEKSGVLRVADALVRRIVPAMLGEGNAGRRA